MQNQARTRAPREHRGIVGLAVAKSAKRMMRQYDLVERVRKYNPQANEALLNRAFVYAMKAQARRRAPRAIPISPIRSKSRRS